MYGMGYGALGVVVAVKCRNRDGNDEKTGVGELRN